MTTITVVATPVEPAGIEDFRLNGTTLTIPIGETTSTGTVTIAAVNNETSADDKEVAVSGAATTTGPGVAQPDVVTLTITDDDSESTTVTLAVSPEAISEGATGSARTVTVSAELDGGARSGATPVTMMVTEGTATERIDFAQVSDFVVTIPAGATSGSATFELTPFDDAIDEPDETVRVTGTLSAAGLTLVQPSGGLTVTIEDNEPSPQVTLVLAPESIGEDGGVSTVTAELDSASTAVTTITVVATPVEPAGIEDFRLNGTTLTIPIGETTSTGTVTITAVDNETEAPNKGVTVTAMTDNDLGVGDPAPRTLTITDDDSESTTVTLSVTPDEVREGDSRTVTVTAELDDSARAGETEIVITVSAGTAAASDFVAVAPFTLTIPADEKNATAEFTLDTAADGTDEPDEMVRVSGRTSGLTVAPSGGVTVTITDADDAPVVMLELDPPSISENGGVSTVTATLDGKSSEPTTVTVSATARSPAVVDDFRLHGTRLTIAAGETASTGTVTIAGVNNELIAPSKQVEVTGVAQNTQGVTDPQPGTLTITDDDQPSTGDQPSTMVTLTVSPDTVPEGGGAARVTVTGALNGAPELADTVVTLEVDAGTALEGAAEATLTIPMGQRNATAVLTLTPVDNRIDAADVTVTVNASNTSTAQSPRALALSTDTTFDVTIVDDDERGVRVTPTKLTVLEGAENAMTYTVALGSEPTSEVTVDVTVQSRSRRARW